MIKDDNVKRKMIAIHVLIDRPIRLESLATWDEGKTTWGGRVGAMGTVPVCVYAQEGWGEGRVVLAGKVVKYCLGSRSLPSNTIANPKGELKAITTRSGIVLDGPSILILPPFINPEEDERVEETLTDQDLADTTSSFPNNLLEEFTDELTLITFPPEYDDVLTFDIESDLKEIEYLLHHDHIKDIDSSLKDLIDQSNLDDLNDNLVDTMPEMFTDEHALDYSSSPLYDEYDNDLLEVESGTEYVYDDPFDSKGEKIKESKLLIDELDLPSDFRPSSEYDSFLSKDFSKVDTSPSTNNKDNVFNLGILI
nr:hypothetical protein [Tanacetum cinerariifolium]